MPDTEYYLNDMRFTTLEYANKWNIIALTMGLGYSSAYEKQQTTLNSIKKSIEEARKREEAMMGFTLALLTGGIVGPIADRFVKKITKGGIGSPLKDGDATDDSLLTEWGVNAIKEVIKAGDDKLRGVALDKLKPAAPAEDAFKPTGMTPHDYTTSLQHGMATRADLMSNVARTWFRALVDMPAEDAKRLHEGYLNSTFFTEVPTSTIDSDELKRSAELMLWIAWARVRDEDHWIIQNALIDSYAGGRSESWHWKPLLGVLTRLRAPVKELSKKPFNYRGDWERVQATIDMPKFIEWAKGPNALKTVFSGLPAKELALSAISKEFQSSGNKSTLMKGRLNAVKKK